MALADFDIVLFGGGGDLAMRKLLPALYARDRANHLPAQARIICVGRHDWSREEFVATLNENAKPHIASAASEPEKWQSFCERVSYISLDATNATAYQPLIEAMRPDPSLIRVFYLATPPSLFARICQCLASAKLANEHSRVVLEKPLGRDLASAKQINAEVGQVFAESQIYRIDHYLGKEGVQNLLALRFGNVLFEPLWRREWISDVQITIAEELGVGNRIEYYDNSGALRDMLQNHLLQLLCIVAMEPPMSVQADAVRDEKLKVLRSLKRFTPITLEQNVVRGQYRSGHVGGVAVPGYRKEGAPADSRTETFVAVKAEIDTWRWSGVPFYLRTGKRMADQLAEIVVRFKSIPHSIFAQATSTFQPNSLVIRLQPDEGLQLNLMAKIPGDRMRLKPVELELDFREQFKMPRMEAYERLLLDVLRGQLTLFMRSDELEAAWEWVEPILNHWEQEQTEPIPYTAGSWGPAAASALIGRDGLQWREEELSEMWATTAMLLDSIRTQLDSLSKSERKVALTVLQNPGLAVSENITALAKNAQVSEPTVVRFCRAVGYDGWHDFKLKLAQTMALALPGADETLAPGDLAADLVSKICSRSINTLLDLRNNLDADAIQRALDILARANKIEFYGQGTSGIIATDAQHKFFRSGVPTVAYSDPHIHSISASLLNKGDAVVAISQRGGSSALLGSIQLARKSGADVIALVPSGTPLAELATVLVPIDLSFNTDPYTPISARLAHLVVIDILAVGLALKRGPEFRKKMLNAQKALQKMDMPFDTFL